MRPGSPLTGSRRALLAMLGVLASCLIAAASVVGVAAAGSPATALWPKFSTPSVVFDVDVTKVSSADLLTATTLQGVYNGEQHPTRLYLDQNATDPFWLSNAIPDGVTVVQIPPPSDGNVLAMLLRRFRPFITGAIVDDYVPNSATANINADTVNLASSMAGVDRAIVINPDQVPLINSLGIPILYTFDPTTFDPWKSSPAQTYQWAIDNGLLAPTSTRMLVELPGGVSGDVRDYGVATGSFFYYMTSTNSAELPVIHDILDHTPVNTPIMGYIPNEGRDVPDLSRQGHFLNASDFLTNASVWAAMPSPSSLRQASQPAPIAAQPNTVYVALMVSDGDNSQYMQHRMQNVWTGPNVGSVPEGWTVAPGALYFDPTMLEWYYRHEPKNTEFVAGPSGIGYATQMTGSNLTQFAQLSGQIMGQDNISTVDDWEALGNQSSNVSQYAQASGLPSISVNAPYTYQQFGSTVAFGQTSGYIASAHTMFCTIYQQSANEQAEQPLFLEPLVDGWDINPTDVLHIAQQLALAGKATGQRYVFLTPSELALTMQHYYAGQESGLPSSNAQSMTGDQTLQEPPVSPNYPASPVQITGPNLVTNPSGASGTTGWTTADPPSNPNGRSFGATLSATAYEGQPALQWTSVTTTEQDWVHYYPAVQNGDTYTFSVQVAGSGQVFMNVWTGTTDIQSLPVNLSSSFQTLTWTATIPNNAPTGQMGQAPQLQVRESGAGPVTVYFRNASVAASNAPC